MNPFEMVVLIVAIVMIASVFKARAQSRGTPVERDDDGETLRLRDEVKALKERIKVIERITVEKENSLSRQIEELRDR